MDITFGPSDSVSATKLAIYIPNKDKHGKRVPYTEHWVHDARLMFTTLFGGSTCSLDNLGMWYCKEQSIYIDENTAIISSIVKTEDVAKHLEIIKAFIQDFLHMTQQDAMAIEFNGEMHFVYKDPLHYISDTPLYKGYRLAS